MTSKLLKDDRMAVAYALYNSKHEYSCVLDRNNIVIAGYGELKQDGEYEYPLIVEDYDDIPFVDIVPWDIAKKALNKKGWPELSTH